MEQTFFWIEDLVQALEETDMNWNGYVNIENGDILFVPQQKDDFDTFSEEEQQLFYEIDALKGYKALPTQKELKEFDVMEQYALDQVNLGFKKRLLFALKNGKPFRNFRSQLRLLNLEEDYIDYRGYIFAAKARAWCLEHDIPFQTDTKEYLEYFKQIEEDEKLEKDLDEFEDTLDEFEYQEEYEDYFE